MIDAVLFLQFIFKADSQSRLHLDGNRNVDIDNVNTSSSSSSSSSSSYYLFLSLVLFSIVIVIKLQQLQQQQQQQLWSSPFSVYISCCIDTHMQSIYILREDVLETSHIRDYVILPQGKHTHAVYRVCALKIRIILI